MPTPFTRVLALAATLVPLAAFAQSPVERHGQLRTDGGRIVDACGRATQLTGVSLTAHHWDGEWWNRDVVQWLRDDWRIELLRAPLGVANYGVYGFDPYYDEGEEYIGDPVGSTNKMRTVVDAALDAGVYVIVDFHSHNKFTDRAVNFFSEMSAEYGDNPNVIYEIWNEPVRDGLSKEPAEVQAGWDEIQAYAREVIAAIRANDPDNLIVVPTPVFDQWPDIVARDPLTTDASGRTITNVAYTVHFYAGGGGADFNKGIRDRAQVAIDAGYPIFVTECGRVGFNYGPGNSLDADEWNRWQSWMDANAVSYAKWHITDKDERTAMLKPSASRSGGWSNADLSDEGRWDRNHFRGRGANPPSRCGSGGTGNGNGGGGKIRQIYSEQLDNRWANWSWGGRATADDGLARVGSRSFRYIFDGAGGALSFSHPTGFSTENLVAVEFYARTWKGTVPLAVSGSYDTNFSNRSARKRITVTPTWKKFRIERSHFGTYGWLKRFFFANRNNSGAAIYVDDVRLVYGPSSAQLTLSADEPSAVATATLTVTPNPNAGAFAADVELLDDVSAATVQLLDATGRVVSQRTEALVAGANRLSLDYAGQVGAGIYSLRVLDASGARVAPVTRIAIR